MRRDTDARQRRPAYLTATGVWWR
eukprot:COSAG02_NODE_19020_length_905_cov_0.533499_2_plen_23_part_01